jgi:hypothetical protein
MWILTGLLGLLFAHLHPTHAFAVATPPTAPGGVYLNPNTGRFWTMDTYEGKLENPCSIHKYLYVHGNPVNMVDPSGHEGNFISMLASLFTAEGLQAIKAVGDMAVRWELKDIRDTIKNDFSLRDRDESLGAEGERVWVKYLNANGFRATTLGKAVSANGPDVYAIRAGNGRVALIIGEVKASRSYLGAGRLKWNIVNGVRQMSYAWLDRYASQILNGFIELGLRGIGADEVERMLERGEIDLYLLGAMKAGGQWKIRGFRLLHVNLDEVETALGGFPEITRETTLPASP